ncbi:MAG: hypothetical protein ACYC3L_04380 [Gemmatimonadaceae bacterium]
MTTDETSFEQVRRDQGFLATKPTAFTRYRRTSLPWQVVRFIVINLKMMRVIWKSHR